MTLPLSGLTPHPQTTDASVLPRLRPATLALDGGLQVDPLTGAIAPGIVMSVNNRFTPGAGAFSAEGAGDLTALRLETPRGPEESQPVVKGCDAASRRR